MLNTKCPKPHLALQVDVWIWLSIVSLICLIIK